MQQSLIDRLSVITEEESEYLGGKRSVEKSKYFGTGTSIISDKRLFPEESGKRGKKDIEIRTHTRFIDFPLHGHDYIEMMYVCSGSITHISEDEEITLTKGGVLLMNRHVKHSVKRAGVSDIDRKSVV